MTRRKWANLWEKLEIEGQKWRKVEIFKRPVIPSHRAPDRMTTITAHTQDRPPFHSPPRCCPDRDEGPWAVGVGAPIRSTTPRLCHDTMGYPPPMKKIEGPFAASGSRVPPPSNPTGPYTFEAWWIAVTDGANPVEKSFDGWPWWLIQICRFQKIGLLFSPNL